MKGFNHPLERRVSASLLGVKFDYKWESRDGNGSKFTKSIVYANYLWADGIRLNWRQTNFHWGKTILKKVSIQLTFFPLIINYAQALTNESDEHVGLTALNYIS